MTIYRDQLEAVYQLIEKPEHWTKGTYARPNPHDSFDGEWGPDINAAKNPDATCWCLWGAAFKCGVADSKEQDDAFTAALGFKYSTDPNDFNDSHTHAEVLALLKSAIDRAPVRLS